MSGKNIRALYEDSQGAFWTGSYDGGMGRLKDGRLTRYMTRTGLFRNGAFQFLEGAFGNLWMSGNRGLYRASKRELADFA